MDKFDLILLLFIIVTVVVSVTLIIRDYYVKLKWTKQALQKEKTVVALLQKLSENHAKLEVEFFTMAADPSLRLPLYFALQDANLHEHFPSAYYTEEKGAEAYMVNWLEFPTELGKAPDEIMLMRVITPALEQLLYYYVFQFRSATPAWASKLNWMIGVCGPYDGETKPFELPRRIYSRFNTVSEMTPQNEVDWVHQNIKV